MTAVDAGENSGIGSTPRPASTLEDLPPLRDVVIGRDFLAWCVEILGCPLWLNHRIVWIHFGDDRIAFCKSRRIGFCNAFCRDKTVADPEAWPKFIALYQS